MVEVIKRGQLPIERVYEFTCSHCHSQLRATEGEGTVKHDQREGSYVTFTCPVCVNACFVQRKSRPF